MASTPSLTDVFLAMARIPSPSGQERGVADWAANYLSELGLDLVEDDAAATIGGDTGNLIARLPPTAAGVPIFLCAHLDTVPVEGSLDPVVEDGILTNAGGTILGADNKAAVAVMLEGVRRVINERRPHAGIELVLTPMEETGCDGVKALDLALIEAEVGFVYDHAAPIGAVVGAAPFQQTLDVTFAGRKAHAGIVPEEGRSAIVAAAKAVSELRLGRLDGETTANVGLIEGGTARNIIPDRCTLVAEARSLSEDTVLDVVGEMLDSLTFAAAHADCEVETMVHEKYRGYRFRRDDDIVQLGFEALICAGVKPQLVNCGGGADANVFNDRGRPCLNLANGMKEIHTPAESISVSDLEQMLDVTLALVDCARSRVA